jgi:FMN phosphatase YigB (HAD superfamily)
MRPAKAIGCKTVWLNGAGWEDTPGTGELVSEVDAEITDFAQLPEQLARLNGKAAQSFNN